MKRKTVLIIAASVILILLIMVYCFSWLRPVNAKDVLEMDQWAEVTSSCLFDYNDILMPITLDGLVEILNHHQLSRMEDLRGISVPAIYIQIQRKDGVPVQLTISEDGQVTYTIYPFDPDRRETTTWNDKSGEL